MSKNGWRQKVESDMAISGLLALNNILDLLYENGKHMSGIVSSLTIWFVSLSLSAVSLNCVSKHKADDFVTNCDTGHY